jgi:hypothetical protein
LLTHTSGRDRNVLEHILSGETMEIVVENIHEYLRSVGENVRAGRMKQEDFIIFKVCAQSWRPTEIHARHLIDI